MSNETFITLFMLGVLVVIFLVACLIVPNFYKPQNIINILTNNWYIVIIGIGVTFLLITGNFDMSVGGVIAMTGVLSVYFCPGVERLAECAGERVGLALRRRDRARAAVCDGCRRRSTHSSSRSSRCRPSSSRLGTMMLARGVGQVVTQGAQRNTSLPDVFGVIGNAAIPGTTHQILGADHGRAPDHRRLHLRAQDGGRPAHVPDRRQPGSGPAVRHQGGEPYLTLFILSALLAGITGILLTSEYKAGLSSRAMGYEFDALVVALLGGVSIAGGFGSVLGMFVGAILLSVMTTAATGLLLSPDWQFTLKAVVTFVAILAQRWALDRRSRG